MIEINHYLVSAFVFAVIFILTGPVLNYIYSLLEKLTRRTKTELDDRLVHLTRRPLRFFIKSTSFLMAINMLLLAINSEASWSIAIRSISGHLIKSALIITVCWAFSRLTSHMDHLIAEFKMIFQVELSHMVAPFVGKMLNFVMWALGVMMIMAEFEFDVSGFVAGLGLSGLAVALAGKSMLANVFGGFALLGDKTFDIGDWIVTDGLEGTVENISLWSTKVRTFDKGLVTVPNEILAGNKILNYSKRNQRRVSFQLGITYETPKEKVSEVIQSIKAMLVEHEKVANDLILVNFENFGDSALEIKVYFFTKTSVWEEYLSIREDVNLKIMELLKELNVEVAFPSMTVYRA